LEIRHGRHAYHRILPAHGTRLGRPLAPPGQRPRRHHGISFADYQLLLHLQRAEGGRLRRVDLAEKLGLTASGVTRSLLPLEKIGLVDRQSDPRDARVGYAIVTAAGSELVTNATTVVDNVSRAMLGAPSREQLEATSKLLAQLAGTGA
jgi:DNA-binding MarR family transcriptional regulator